MTSRILARWGTYSDDDKKGIVESLEDTVEQRDATIRTLEQNLRSNAEASESLGGQLSALERARDTSQRDYETALAGLRDSRADAANLRNQLQTARAENATLRRQLLATRAEVSVCELHRKFANFHPLRRWLNYGSSLAKSSFRPLWNIAVIGLLLYFGMLAIILLVSFIFSPKDVKPWARFGIYDLGIKPVVSRVRIVYNSPFESEEKSKAD